MKMNQSYLFRIGVSVMLLIGGSAAQGSERVSKQAQQQGLLHELVNASLKEFHARMPYVEMSLQYALLSCLVEAHIDEPDRWEALILEAKIDGLVDELQRFKVPESVKSEWIKLYHRTTLKRFRLFVEGLAKGSTALLRIGLGNSPDPRVPGNSSVHALGRSKPGENITGKSPVKRLNVDQPADKDGVSWTAMLTGVAFVGVGLWIYAVSHNSKNIEKDSLAGALVRKFMGNVRKV